ncbi:hypothetical protein B0X71_19095 (plasmid) [Planococcus lenghuensis]|uniref:Uncharacterized protein n=1 Tax=Planococcus lenghuensis TaxID=2213202 RepID=A0A1Q2L5B5_9BACL|nr:hypothetical protein B0X71_19095 [Planococcus lenghuensis]
MICTRLFNLTVTVENYQDNGIAQNQAESYLRAEECKVFLTELLHHKFPLPTDYRQLQEEKAGSVCIHIEAIEPPEIFATREIKLLGVLRSSKSNYFCNGQEEPTVDLKHIKELLTTISQYHTVNITQNFTKMGTDWIQVKCLPDTRVLELTYIQTQVVEYYESIDDAANIIASQLNSTTAL